MSSGLQEDCPFIAASSTADGKAEYLTAESVDGIDTEAFAEYAGRINQYLQVCASPLPMLFLGSSGHGVDCRNSKQCPSSLLSVSNQAVARLCRDVSVSQQPFDAR